MSNPQHTGQNFRSLVGAQFLGAFNDNLFKQLILFLAASTLFPGEDKQGIAFAVFALPFVIFSGMAGNLSEKYSKGRIIRTMKYAEVLVMTFGVLAFHQRSWTLLLITLGLMGVQSAFFGPSKYGVIPEIVPTKGLVEANGTIAMTTFMGVLFGQALAGPLLDGLGEDLWLVGGVCVGFAVLGSIFARRIGPIVPLRPNLQLGRSPFGDLKGTISVLRSRGSIFRIVVLNSLFWFNAGVLQQGITGLSEPGALNIQEGEHSLLSLILVCLALGIIIGSRIAPIAVRRWGLGRVCSFGVIGMCLCQSLFLAVGPVVGRHTGGLELAMTAGILIGLFGAFFVVPVQAYLQNAPSPGMRGQTFAVNNFMNFLCLFMGGVWYMLFRGALVSDLTISAAATQFIAALIFIVAFAFLRRELFLIEIKEGDAGGR